jgi:hypothetical protein
MSNASHVILLEPEVTPGLLAGAEPDAHQFNVTICLKGDQMEVILTQYNKDVKETGIHQAGSLKSSYVTRVSMLH